MIKKIKISVSLYIEGKSNFFFIDIKIEGIIKIYFYNFMISMH